MQLAFERAAVQPYPPGTPRFTPGTFNLFPGYRRRGDIQCAVEAECLLSSIWVYALTLDIVISSS